MTRLLVDSSAWIDYFRGVQEAVARIDPALADGRAAISGPVYAEVVSGSRDAETMDRLARLLKSLDWLPEPRDVWEKVGRARFLLGRQGFQASIVDLYLAVTASEAGCDLLTRDRDFERIRRVIPVGMRVF